MWSVQKNLLNLISGIIIHKKYDLFPSFQDELNKNSKIFLDILKDAPSSQIERDKIRKSSEEPIFINYLKIQKKLQPSLIEEAIALSDLFGLSEYAAVELLIEAEEQMQYFHGFNRGLTAILLYYDSKKLLVNNLKLIISARPGRTWVLDEEIPQEVSNFINDYVNNLIKNGLINKILNQIALHDWAKTEENLMRVNGLGSLKHRKQVKNLHEEIKTTLAECIYDCACQLPLNKNDSILIIDFLKNNCQTIQSQSLNPIQTIENCYMYLIMSLLYCFDSSYLENKEQNQNDTILESFLENEYIKSIYNHLKLDNQWASIGVKSVLQFSFQIFLIYLNNYMLENENQQVSQLLSNCLNGLEEDETLIDKAIEQHVFSFLKNVFIKHEKFSTEKYFIERIHSLITDFIYKMPEKIKDMRNRNEDIIRLVEDSYSLQNPNISSFYTQSFQQAQLKPEKSSENHDFEEFLNLIGQFYSNDPLKLELCLNFWIADSEMNPNMPQTYQKPTQKQISLYKFIRYFLSGDTLIGSLYISYVNMLTGLCTGEESSQHCFLLLQSNAHFYESHGPKISWTHILYAFEKYYDSFRMDQNLMTQQFNYQTPSRSHNKGITQQELQGLISVTKLVNQISLYNEKARLSLCEYQRGEMSLMTSFSNLAPSENNLPTIMFGLLTCSIPISLKGEILNLLASFALSSNLCLNIWQLLENSQVLTTLPQQQGFNYYRSDIKLELEEVESREETYPLLKGFLSLIKNLVTNSSIPDNLGIGLRPKNSILGFQPYLQFLVNHVYLKVLYRSYKNAQEKWQLVRDLLDIFYQIILKYEVQSQDFMNVQQDAFQISAFKSPVSNSPGYRLIYDFIHDGPIVRMLFIIINECLNHLLEFNLKNEKFIEKTSLICLKIIILILEKQKFFIEKMKLANLSIESTGLEKLIISLNPASNRADYFMSILRFIQFNSYLINHSFCSIQIIYMLSNYSLINTQLLNLFLKSCLSFNEQFELMHSFVEFLEFDESTELTREDNLLLNLKTNLDSLDESTTSVSSEKNSNTESNLDEIRSQSRLTALRLLLFYLRLPAPNFSHLLLGFDINKPLKNQNFLNPGTKISYARQKDGTEPEILSIVPRNCLHSIIRLLNKFIRDSTVLNKMSQTIDTCYEILFILCSNIQFNQQLLNYLRSEFDFVNNNIKKIPISDIGIDQACLNRTAKFKEGLNRTLKETQNILFQQNETLKRFKNDLNETESSEMNSNMTCLYSIYSWIIQLTCIEIQSLISNRMKTQLKKLVQLLTENSAPELKQILSQKEQRYGLNSTNFDSLVYLNSSISRNKTGFGTSLIGDSFGIEKKPGLAAEDDLVENNKFYDLIKFINFSQHSPECLNLNYFDSQLIEKVIESCKFQPDYLSLNVHLYDLKKLKNILYHEIKDAGINVSRANLLNELKYILQNVYERNQFQINFVFKKKYFDNLKLLIESFVMLTPCDVFNLNQRFHFLVCMVKKLFASLHQDNLIVELTFQVASIFFTLITNLRQVVAQLKKTQTLSDISGVIQQSQQQQQVSNINLSSLVEIFKKIIEYLLNSSLTNFKVRTHLYATILNYLMIFDHHENKEKKANEFYENIRILLSNMNNLLKVICTDSCEGLNITTMMGLSLLNKIIDLDSNNSKWIKYLNDNGYITCIINTLTNTDNQLLEEMFHSQAKNDKVIYIFETKIALFSSISKNLVGSEFLIKNGLVNALVNCTVFNLRIKFDRNLYSNRNSAYLIQLLNQYYQLFFPILNLFISILNTMGSNNIETKSQISKFVLSHHESFLHILTSKISDLKMLEELKLVTCLLAKLAPFDSLKFENVSQTSSSENNSVFSRIHKEFLNLICVYFVPEQLRQIRKEIEHHTMIKENLAKTTNSYLTEISTNISSYCTSIMKVGQLNIPFLIFSPKIESHHLHPYSPTMIKLNSKDLQIGLLIDYIKYSLDNLEKTIEIEMDLKTKNEHINDLIEIEKKQLIGEYKLYEKMSETEKHLYLKDQLSLSLKSVKKDLFNLNLTIEKLVLILWRHIEFYLTDPNMFSYQLFKNDVYTGNGFNEDSSKTKIKSDLNKEDFVKFKQDLLTCLGPNFFKKCSDLEQKVQQESKRNNFLNILLKRIQRLVHLQTTPNQ